MVSQEGVDSGSTMRVSMKKIYISKEKSAVRRSFLYITGILVIAFSFIYCILLLIKRAY